MNWARVTTRLAAAGVGSALAAGCQTPTDNPKTGVKVEMTTSASGRQVRPASATEASAAQTVHPANFDRPVGEPDAIDLGAALRLAGVGNPTINLARERVRESLADQLAARALLLPSVNVGGNYRYHSGPLLASFGGPRDVNLESLYLGAGAGVIGGGSAGVPGVQLFVHLGDAAYEPLAARQRVTVRRSEAQAAQNAVLLETVAAYLELVGAEGRLDILKQGETDLQEIARLTAAYAKAGQGRQADANRAATNLELLRRELRRADEDAGVASARLCRFLNLDPSVQLRTPGGAVQPVRLVPEDADVEGLIASAVDARPEVVARSAAISEAQTRVRQERMRPFLPTVSVGYSGGGFGGSPTASDFGPLRTRSEFDAVAVWGLQNLGLGNRARTRAANARVGAAVADYDLALNQIRREVSEALADAQATSQQSRTADVALTIAEEGFKLESDRIRQGPGRPLELIDSFRQLIESRQELLRAVIAFNAAQFRLFVALGSNPATGPVDVRGALP